MKKIALILSGGAARGAYEVGVLKAILPEIQKHGGVSILCGTSVGSINASYLASIIHLPIEKIIENMEHYWLTFKKDHVYAENWTNGGLRNFLGSLKLGMPDFQGLLNYSPLRKVLDSEMNWEQLKKNIDDKLIYALTVTCTSVTNGRPVVFYQSSDPNCVSVISTNTQTRFVPDIISSDHIIGSCSIPIFFKPEHIKFKDHNQDHADWFCDGGVRQNTPLQAALTLGADALIIVGLHYMFEDGFEDEEEKPGLLPNIGKLLNALFLDSVRHDTNRLRKVNEILEAIDDPEVIERINKERMKHGGKKYKIIPDLFITPSKMISGIAEDIWDKYPETRKNFKTLDWLFKIGNLKGHARGDLLSYFFFNPYYIRELIELGYKDGLESINAMTWDHKKKKNVRTLDKFLGLN